MSFKELYIKGIKIDPNIFTFKFGCRCNGECCHYGVYTDLKEYEKILDIKDKIIPLMDETQSKNISHWFEPAEEDDDFGSGVAVGTEIFNEKCAFLDKNGLCVLQRLALEEGEHKWKYKPIYCVLFPLTIYQNTLTIDDEHIDRLSYCNKFPISDSSIFDACKEELEFFFGKEGFEELLKYKEEVLSQVQNGVIANGNKK
jgi:Fe-S-cluster containining protein